MQGMHQTKNDVDKRTIWLQLEITPVLELKLYNHSDYNLDIKHKGSSWQRCTAGQMSDEQQKSIRLEKEIRRLQKLLKRQEISGLQAQQSQQDQTHISMINSVQQEMNAKLAAVEAKYTTDISRTQTECLEWRERLRAAEEQHEKATSDKLAQQHESLLRNIAQKEAECSIRVLQVFSDP